MTSHPRIGSLFAGYGGLELGVAHILGGEPAWFSEIDPAPSRVLAHHWPDVPNHGDITTIDWDSVEPIDVLTGGFPCQDVSHAGKRLGLKPGTRSGLWSHMAYAIDKLRPRLVVAENVRGLLSAEAGGDLEPCPWCMGDESSSPLRALGAVLGDLADLRYDAQWVGVRASDAGAPHGRFRVFVYAWPAADTAGADPRRRGWRGHGPGAAAGERDGWPEPGDGDLLSPADADRLGHQRPRDTRGRRPRPTDSGDTPTDTTCDGRHEGRTEPTRLERGPHAPELGAVAWGGYEPEARRTAAPTDTPSVSDADVTIGGDSAGQHEWSIARSGDRAGAGNPAAGVHDMGGTPPLVASWGEYEPAIRRWEHLTRPAPPPTEPGKGGAARLSPRFVEWLMGLPAGHVTDVPGLSRNGQLKVLGNGVVPAQAALATRIWAAITQGTYPTTTTTQDDGAVLPTPSLAGHALGGGKSGRDKLQAMGWIGGGTPTTEEATGTDDGRLW